MSQHELILAAVISICVIAAVFVVAWAVIDSITSKLKELESDITELQNDVNDLKVDRLVDNVKNNRKPKMHIHT